MAVLAAVAAYAAVTVNGLPTVGDIQRGLLLCSVPEACFGLPYTAVVACDDSTATMAVNDVALANGDSIVFDDITRNHTFTFTVSNGTVAQTWQLAFTCLPIATLNGSFTSDYSPCTMTLTLPGEVTADTLTAKGKYRGGITNSPESHKHNFHVKLLDSLGNKESHPLLGMRNDNNWILDAGQIDLARIRNHVGMELWREFSTPPYYFDLTPNAVNGVHCEYVEMFVNGDYHGLNSLGEAIDRKQLRLKKFDEDTGEIHGLLWKTVGWEDPVRMYTVRNDYNNYSDRWGGVALKYPDLDEVSPTDWTALYEAAHFVTTSDPDTFCAHVAEYFDLPVLRDYYLFCQLLKAIDNRGKNMYWFIHDQAADRRISVTPWDLDATAGQYWTDWWEASKAATVNPTVDMPMDHNLFDCLLKYNPNGFNTQVLRRYWQLRESTFAPDSLIARYITPLEQLQRAGTVPRETRRWSGDTDIARLALDFDQQKALITEWFPQRIAVLDQKFARPEIPGDINGDLVVDVDDLNIVINIILRKNVEPSTENLADLTSDDVVDIDDLNAIINIMLGKE